MDPAESLRQVAPMQRDGPFDVSPKRFAQALRQERRPVLLPFPVADEEMPLAEVDVLDPEPEAFHQPEPRAVEQPGHQPGRAVELGEDRADLVAGQDDRQPLRPLGPDHVVADPVEGPVEDDLIEEQQGGQSLILGRGRDLPVDRQMVEEGYDLSFSHLVGMPFAVEEDELPDPADVSLLRPDAVMKSADRVADPIEQPRSPLGG